LIKQRFGYDAWQLNHATKRHGTFGKTDRTHEPSFEFHPKKNKPEENTGENGNLKKRGKMQPLTMRNMLHLSMKLAANSSGTCSI